MSIEILYEEAVEGGTYIISMDFKDEKENNVIPYNLSWSLYNEYGNIVNDRQDINLLNDSSLVEVGLSGNDLEGGYETFVIKGNYDSDYGKNLPITDSTKFYVRGLTGE